MTALTSVAALSSPGGAPCVLDVIRGLLNRGTSLEVFYAGDWKPLIQARVVIDGESPGGTVYLYTLDTTLYQARPDDLIRVRIQKSR